MSDIAFPKRLAAIFGPANAEYAFAKGAMANYDETNALDPMVSPAGSVRNPSEKVTVLSSSENVIECERYQSLARSSGRALGSLARFVREKPELSMIAAAAGGLFAGFAVRRL